MGQEAVQAHGGTVAKFIGDGIMAMFGIPEVAEDDAERAVAAGLELQRRFGEIGNHVSDGYGIEAGLRVGINTGEVMIADDDADVVGDALNTAARLEAACTPGQVLVGEATWRLTRGSVQYHALGKVVVKGKSDPMATFQVIDQTTQEDQLVTPFVGREAEPAQLYAAFDAACTDRVARLVTVIGSPGVGKTRLARELVRERAEQARTFDLRCERSGTATFAPVADLLRYVAEIQTDFTPDQALATLKAFVGESVPDSECLIELLGSFVGAAPSGST